MKCCFGKACFQGKLLVSGRVGTLWFSWKGGDFSGLVEVSPPDPEQKDWKFSQLVGTGTHFVCLILICMCIYTKLHTYDKTSLRSQINMKRGVPTHSYDIVPEIESCFAVVLISIWLKHFLHQQMQRQRDPTQPGCHPVTLRGGSPKATPRNSLLITCGNNSILLMEEILHHLVCIKPCI